MVTEDEARAWCEELASKAEHREIDRDGRPYLTRYYVAGWTPDKPESRGALFLHHFVASDAENEVHSHPWRWGMSLILAGSYREERCDQHNRQTVRVYAAGDVNILRPNDRHRIDLVGRDCWTLFFAGAYAQPWGFSPACR